MKRQCLVLLVENNAGVLARISSLFVQRGFNIDSLTVSPTETEKLSRITLVTTGDTKTLNQIIKQSSKLNEAKLVFPIEEEFSLVREILMVKFANDNANKDEIIKIGDSYGAKVIDSFGANIIDITNGCFVAELSASSQKIDEFLEATAAYEMIEMCRSGAIAMERGKVSYDIN